MGKRTFCKECGKKTRSDSGYCWDCSPLIGTYIRTEETKKRMSIAQKGRPHTWAIGKKRPDVGKKIAAAWTPEMKEAARQRGLLNAENQQWLLKIARALSGEKNPNYQGKNQAKPYAPGWGRGYRRKLREKAKGICEICKKKKKWLDLHHKDFSTDNHSPDNIQVICRSCHKILHFANSAKT